MQPAVAACMRVAHSGEAVIQPGVSRCIHRNIRGLVKKLNSLERDAVFMEEQMETLFMSYNCCSARHSRHL